MTKRPVARPPAREALLAKPLDDVALLSDALDVANREKVELQTRIDELERELRRRPKASPLRRVFRKQAREAIENLADALPFAFTMVVIGAVLGALTLIVHYTGLAR